MSNSVRSVTVPLESNPIRQRITRELNKLRAWEESSTSAAETIAIGLSGIADLHKCIGHFLTLPFIQQALSLHQHNKSFLELIQGSNNLLEVCSAAGDVALQTTEASRSLSSSLHSNNNNNHDVSLSHFCHTRKQIIKSAKKTILSLRRVERQCFGSCGSMLDYEEFDNGVLMVIKELTCVSIISISVLEAVLYFLAMPVTKGKPGNFRFFSKMMLRRAKVGCDGLGEDQSKNELENLNFAISGLMCSDNEESVGVLCKRLDALDVGLDGISNGVESMSSHLAQTRTTLLEISRIISKEY